MANELIKATYEVAGEQINLDSNTVKQYLVNGQGNVTDQEVKFFIELCKAQKLNPFVKDAYLIKYGNSPAQTITSKDVFLKRAEENPDFDGLKAGVIVDNGEDIIYRNGSFYNKKKEQLVGGWCEVYRKNQKEPMRVEVEFDEYAGRTKEGNLNSMWASKGSTMIRKVALCQALREAFPNAFQQLYGAEEMNSDIESKPQEPVQETVEQSTIDLSVVYNDLRSQIEATGVDTRSEEFINYVVEKAQVNDIDISNLIVDEEGMQRVINVFEGILLNKQQNEKVEVVEAEIVEQSS